jgi:protein SERAC1
MVTNSRFAYNSIVAVHGLNGDATRTWTARKSGVFWLSHPDLLPRYIKNARVLVWGYNSSFSNLTGVEPSKNQIHHHAQTLVAQLYADRKLEGRVDKPIIFICHSLGGLVVKRVSFRIRAVEIKESERRRRRRKKKKKKR